MHQLPSGTVTLLFSDIEESTRLLQQLGTQYSELLNTCRHFQRTAFEKNHGYEVDTQGDAFFVSFARASDAVAAAVAAQRALANHPWPEGVSVRVRMGLHTGEPGLSAEGYVGLDVHRAARIMGCAHGGQILLSQTTRALVEHDLPTGVSLRELGAHRLKDLQQPIHLFQLVIPDLPTDFPPLLTLDRHTHNLPVQLTSFIGREKEVAKVSQLLLRDDVRLLTLTGPGGIGKTRLGLQVAAELSDHFADGVFFVNLAPIGDPALVLPTIAQTLGVQESATRPMLDILQAVLLEKQMLLVLDNFEQVVGAAVEVAALLARCPRLKVLVTSRATLHLSGEHQFPVTPLTLPDPGHPPDLIALSQYEAVALFIARATAARPEFQVTNATATAIAEICVRLDGLPLAIELAAARITLLPPQALLARLGQRLALLTGGVRDAPARQHTLRSTIAWSYDLLEDEEQRLFRRLCVFVGGMTLSAVEAVSAALGEESGSVLDGIASLIDKSLLRQSEPHGEQPRFVMLETIREYGWEALSASGEAETTRQAHAAYYLALAKEAAPKLLGPQLAQWMRWLELEHDNLRAAMNWLLERGEAAMALRMGAALALFWELHYSFHEGWNVLSRALEASEEVPERVRARGLVAAGWMALRLGHFERAEMLCQESLALFRSIGDRAGMGHAVFLLAQSADERGDVVAALSRYKESIVLNREASNKTLIAWSLILEAYVALFQGEYAGARAGIEESLALFREMSNPYGTAYTLRVLALYAIVGPGDLPLDQGHLLAEKSLALFRDISSRNFEPYALAILGEITFFQGDTTTARQLLEQSCTTYRELGNEPRIAWTLSLLGRVLAAEDDLAGARAAYEESLLLERRVNFDRSYLDIAPALEGLAAVVAAQEEPTWAARLLGRAEAQRETIKAPLPQLYRANYDHAVALARSRLDESSFEAAWAEGRAMTLEQVIVARGPVTMTEPLPTSQPEASPLEKSFPSYPDGLTARELEVLQLVAQGFTSAQIAEQLVIGLATVNFHVRSIYSKLGVSSRSAATRYAIEHNLV
jgi:predicted ATPase/class 3 adenylate cyclase/DNA-binding CsgD family transcriptional regulator